MIKESVFGKHADANTKIHCLYGYFYQGINLTKLATIYTLEYHILVNIVAHWVIVCHSHIPLLHNCCRQKVSSESIENPHFKIVKV